MRSDMERLLRISREYAENISLNISDRENDPRSMCFWNIYNRIRITYEILDLYEKPWKASPEADDGDLEKEMIERIVTVTKNLFVDIVSMIEKTSKDSVEIYKNSDIRQKALDERSFLYLRNIIHVSMEAGIISKKEFDEWDDILLIRNLVVHNNSVSDRSKRFVVSGISISMRPGRMMKGPLNTFLILSERMIALFHRWLTAIHAIG